MDVLTALDTAVQRFSDALSEFPIGAVALDDLKPIEEKLKDTKDSVRHLDAQLLMLKARIDAVNQDSGNIDVTRDIASELQQSTSTALLNEKITKQCLISSTLLSIFHGKEGDEDTYQKIWEYVNELFTVNEVIMSLQKSLSKGFSEQLELQIQCQNVIYDYNQFLKSEAEKHAKKFEETNPEIARVKQRTKQVIQKINTMKQLMRAFIAASSQLLCEEPVLEEMLAKHRDLITHETIANLRGEK